MLQFPLIHILDLIIGQSCENHTHQHVNSDQHAKYGSHNSTDGQTILGLLTAQRNDAKDNTNDTKKGTTHTAQCHRKNSDDQSGNTKTASLFRFLRLPIWRPLIRGHIWIVISAVVWIIAISLIIIAIVRIICSITVGIIPVILIVIVIHYDPLSYPIRLHTLYMSIIFHM